MKIFKNKFLFFLLFCSSFSQPNLYATQKGSETAISIEPHATFPSIDLDNTMLAFGWFKNGFTLQDDSTSCTFESVFPVSGDIYLNGGNLYLNTDLNFNNRTNILSYGNFYADSNLIELPETSNTLSATQYDAVFKNAELFFYSDLTLSGTIKFQGNSTLNGHRSNIYLNSNAKIIIDTNSTLKMQNLILHNISNDKIICQDNSSKIVLDDIEWNQDGNYTFSIGSIKFVNNNKFSGEYIFEYASPLTSTIDGAATWHIAEEMQLRIGRYDSSNNLEPLYMQDSSSLLLLDNCTLDITSSGAQFRKGSIYCDRDVYVSLNSTSSNTGIIFGDGISENDLSFKFYPGAAAYFTAGHVVLDVTDGESLSFKDCNAKLIRSDNSIFYCNQNQTLSNFEISRGTNNQLILASGKILKYEDCDTHIPGCCFTLTGTQLNSYSIILDGVGQKYNQLTITGGNFPAIIYVNNTVNYVRGNCNISGPVMLQNSDANVIFGYDGSFNNNIYLNGGSMSLVHNLHLSQNYKIEQEGTINLSFYSLCLGSEDSSWTSTIYWNGNNSKINMNANINLSGSWTFSGNCSINGNGNSLNLGNTGEIKVEKGSTLILERLTLSNLHENKLICLDNNSKIQLKNTKIKLDGNYTFSIGSFEFFKDVDLCGSYTFEYNSAKPSIIKKYAEFSTSDNITFKTGTSIITPLEFTNKTSKFRLKNSMLNVGNIGMQLTKGTIVLDGKLNINTTSTESTNGLIMGNNNEEDDITVDCLPAARITLSSGALVCNNINPYTFQSQSLTTHMIRKPGTYFYINNDFVIKNQTTEISPDSALIVKDGKQLLYELCKVFIPGTVFIVTGERYNAYTTLLSGNNEIFIHEGIMPLYTIVQNTNNKILGTGSISGLITLYDENAELSLNLDGEISNEIYLNGGTLNLEGNLEVLYDNTIMGPGIVEMGSKNLLIGSKTTNWTTTLTWIGNDSQISLNSTTTLSNIWTFSGVCTIDGRNNILNLENNSKICVHDNSTLIFRRIKLFDIGSHKIECLTNSSKIIFDDVIMTMPYQDFHFSAGSFEVYNKLWIEGKNSFKYQTNQQSIIHPNATLRLTEEATLSYEPNSNSDSLISLQSSTSRLYLYDSSLHSTSTGIRLTKGKLIIKGDCSFLSDATVECEGLKFGDGINEGNDLEVTIKPESNLNLASGHILNENVN